MEGTEIRRCSRCCLSKPISEFGRRSRGGFQPYCRLCQSAYKKEHYGKNKATYIRGAKQRRKRLWAEVRAFKEQPCADCGVRYPYWVMDFDHREGEEKGGVINRMVMLGWSRDKIFAEIAKCDVVCANCHRMRTWQRKQMVPRKYRKAALGLSDLSDAKNSDGQSCQ